MKTLATYLASASRLFTMLLLGSIMVGSALGQTTKDLQYFRAPGQSGINVFEAPKTTTVPFDGLDVRIGGDFAIQFQGLDHENEAGNLIELADNLNLPTANFNVDVQLAEGMRMHLRTYLSSRHHTEAWVKGGYLQVDQLDFISQGFLSSLMEVTRFRFGMDEINYGDAHFRRSDNAQALYNPFVENYIMDSFGTEPFAEVSFLKDGLIGVAGVSNGRLNQSPTPGDGGFALYGKVGVDRMMNDALRLRLTGSVYHSTDKGTRDYLYSGDRAGSRYYNLFEVVDEARPSDFLPRYNPGFAYQTAFQVNPFVKFQNLEFFGIVERAANGNSDVGGSFTQLGGEVLYRIGSQENFYLGLRYNHVQGEAQDGAEPCTITRLNVGGGWFLTENVLTKVEFVQGDYSGDGFANTKFAGASFNGLMIEAVIAF